MAPLGVAAAGTGGVNTVTFTITTPDADSFQPPRLYCCTLARAVGHGQRNL